MAIRTVVTRGFGNTDQGGGNFDGTIALVVTRGYAIGEAAVVAGVPLTLPSRDISFSPERDITLTLPTRDISFTPPGL